MDDFKGTSAVNIELEDIVEQYSTLLSINYMKSSIPRINFKKIKLNNYSTLCNSLTTKNMTKIFLEDNILKVNFPYIRTTYEKTYEISQTTPLRKKIDLEEKIIEELPLQKHEKELEKQVTFNFEAELAQPAEDNIIFSPAIVSLPPLKKDVLSSSGKQEVFVWPPPEGKKIVTKIKQKRIKKKRTGSKKKETKQKLKNKKPYFLSAHSLPPKAEVLYPWLDTEYEYKGFESIIQGGLESELLDIPSVLPEEEIKSKTKEGSIDEGTILSSGNVLQASQLTLRAITPKFSESFVHLQDDFGIEFHGKVRKMFEKFKLSNLSPLRIVILGGFAATIGYLLWCNFDLSIPTIPVKKQDKVVVRDLFKEKVKTLDKKSQDTKSEKKVFGAREEVQVQKEKIETSIFSPITEEERLALIQKAKDAIESRLDPFGQDLVLPPAVIEQKIKEREEENKPPEDISIIRKQVELVGVISTQNKNIALVNVYTANYTISPLADKQAQEAKLRAELTMAVPSRIEVSILDPIEDWYVKQITKGKTRSEEPTIELVKADKKFKLKVGQRLLFPEEKQFEPQNTLEQSDKISN